MSEENKSKLKISPETEKLINSTTQDSAIKEMERIDKLQKEHEKEKQEWRDEMSQAADKQIDLGKKISSIKDELTKKENDNKALQEALVQQKQKYSTLTEPEERLSYGDKVSKDAYELVLKRCKMGYYGGEPCRECKASLK